MVNACPVVLASRHPSEQELITSYLQPRVSSGKKAASHPFIYNADVYSDDPACLTKKFRPVRSGDGEEVWYFFSPARTKTSRGQRRARTVDTGEGCWHCEAGVKTVLDAGHHRVGYRQFFSFMTKQHHGKRNRTGWLMVELGLDREQQQDNSKDDDSLLVLCKIYFTPRTPVSSAGGRMALDLAGLKRNAAGELVGPSTPPAGQSRPSLSGEAATLPCETSSHSSVENDSTHGNTKAGSAEVEVDSTQAGSGSSGSEESSGEPSDKSSDVPEHGDTQVDGPRELPETNSIAEKSDGTTAPSIENSIAEKSEGTTAASTESPQQLHAVPVAEACHDTDKDTDTMDIDCPTRVETHHTIVDDDDDHAQDEAHADTECEDTQRIMPTSAEHPRQSDDDPNMAGAGGGAPEHHHRDTLGDGRSNLFSLRQEGVQRDEMMVAVGHLSRDRVMMLLIGGEERGAPALPPDIEGYYQAIRPRPRVITTHTDNTSQK
ncbi:hypothetical protein E2562_039081 [Oryza meyeriana var. granulata]|uniref:NAC domain-containing protein n=1 Tax=Oryza meyeriana var. granulata TaxID=110450 RepID=A0A6G1E9N7_9ORYZ|nr:hypothetical protein E2562_039081 [Oryza meyeriana var. granulata]